MIFDEAIKKGVVKSKDGKYRFAIMPGRIYVEEICCLCKERYLRRSDHLQKKNYCSIPCRGKYFTGNKSHAWKGGKIKHECPVCEKIFYTSKNQIDQVCCSWNCARTLEQLEKIKDDKKYCSKCKTWKEFSCFGFSKATLFNLAIFCKDCERKRSVIYNKTDGAKKAKAKYARSNHGKQKLSEYVASGRHAERLKKYRATDKYKSIRRKSSAKARENISIKLNENLRRAINHCLHDAKNAHGYENILGYTIEDLIFHLQKQFCDEMTWENYGKKGWTIDHNIPLSWFNFTTEKDQEFKDAWALKNLQPMWCNENISKKNRYSGKFKGLGYQPGIYDGNPYSQAGNSNR